MVHEYLPPNVILKEPNNSFVTVAYTVSMYTDYEYTTKMLIHKYATIDRFTPDGVFADLYIQTKKELRVIHRVNKDWLDKLINKLEGGIL